MDRKKWRMLRITSYKQMPQTKETWERDDKTTTTTFEIDDGGRQGEIDGAISICSSQIKIIHSQRRKNNKRLSLVGALGYTCEVNTRANEPLNPNRWVSHSLPLSSSFRNMCNRACSFTTSPVSRLTSFSAIFLKEEGEKVATLCTTSEITKEKRRSDDRIASAACVLIFVVVWRRLLVVVVGCCLKNLFLLIHFKNHFCQSNEFKSRGKNWRNALKLQRQGATVWNDENFNSGGWGGRIETAVTTIRWFAFVSNMIRHYRSID